MSKLIFKPFAFIFFFAICYSCSENELFELSPNAAEANLSYENQFKAIWAAIDLNYPIWDFERDEYGLDWDNIYDEYLPKFREYDAKYKETGDSIYWNFVQFEYEKILKNLHDGHLSLIIKDVYSGRNAFWLDSKNNKKELDYYFYHLLLGSTWQHYKDKGYSEYYLLEEKKTTFYWYGLFNNDVVFLHFPDFKISDIFAETDKTNENIAIVDIWTTWFEKVQELYNSGKLKGVILDVRHNPGGYVHNYQYYLGALHGDVDGNESIKTGTYRMKNAIGRFAYSHAQNNEENDFVFKTYDRSHAIIDAPIVVLADSMSASMAEQTCLAAKRLPNAYVIGTHTFGAFSPLTNVKGNNFTTAGNIGDPTLNESSFYIKMPYAAFVTTEGKVIEGKGVEPDKTVYNDNNKRDKQLEFALDFIDGLNKQ